MVEGACELLKKHAGRAGAMQLAAMYHNKSCCHEYLGERTAALQAAGVAVTDESSAVEACGMAPRLVPGALENLKVTWPEDFDLAERLLASAFAPRVTVR